MADADDFFFKSETLESDEENDAVVWAENNGWQARKLQYVGRRGCPDRLFYGYGVFVLIEMKRPSARRKSNGGLDATQVQEFKRFKDASLVVPVCYTSHEVIAHLKGFM